MKALPPIGPQDHVRGAADAALTIVQYGDYACPHTRASVPVLDAILRENEDVRLVFRHFPLHHLHPDAEALALLAEAAGAQGKFWEAHDRIMGKASPDPDEVLAALPELGVDRDAVEALLAEGKLEDRVEDDRRGGELAGVHSTPSFFFDGALHDGKYDGKTLREKLAQARGARG